MRRLESQLAFAFVIRLVGRAAVFLWISPLRAARSSRLVASSLTSAVASDALALFSTVRRLARCARLRMFAARDLRMFFFAESILGTSTLSKKRSRIAEFVKEKS